MNMEITAQSEREFFVQDFFLLRSVSGDFPLARRMRDGHQMKRLDLSFAAQFEL